MNKGRVSFLALNIFCLFASCVLAGDINQIFQEAHNSFTYEQKPIPPTLVRSFLGELSKPALSAAISGDVLAAFSSEEYRRARCCFDV